MWRYELFVPTAVALVIAAGALSLPRREASLGRIWALVLVLAVASWSLVVAYLHFKSDAGAWHFVARRDLGYWIGSLIFTTGPFLALAIMAPLMQHFAVPRTALVAVLVIGVVLGIVFTPWLFYVGWVVGCVAAGYTSCM